MVGDLLSDRYELEELVGTGGMSTVYRAHDGLLDRKVALKILHSHYTGDATYVERFRHEARAVAALSHPNIVTVIDRDEHDGRQFIVFEYVDGENLKRLIERGGPLPVERALELAVQIGRGLAFAHERGLVHRDVKPQNVLLNAAGQAKVTDFGIARSLDMQQGMTQTGTVLGTSDYIAPEQAQGRRVDAHTDIYSLGVVLYELLTSEVPFPGENFVAVAMRHINEPPPSVRDRRPDVSLRLDGAVRRAMAKEADDRFPAMADFCDELEQCLVEARGSEATAPRPVARARARRSGVSPWPLLVVLASLIAIGAVFAVVVIDRGTSVFSGNGSSGGAAAATLDLHAIRAYDPFGTNGENDAIAKLATDGVASTAWSTERYYDAPSLNKPGVGLVLDAGRSVQLKQLVLTSTTPGFDAVIRAGDSPAGPFPSTVSDPQQVGASAQFPIRGGGYRYYLIWITRLGAGFQTARINEVTAS